MTFRLFSAAALALAGAACATAPAQESQNSVCADLKRAYQAACKDLQSDTAKRDCEVAVKADAMEDVRRNYPLDSDDPQAADIRADLIDAISQCDASRPIELISDGDPEGYWNAVGVDQFGQGRRCEGPDYDLIFTEQKTILHDLCDIADLREMTRWRLSNNQLILYNDDAEVMVFERGDAGWRSLDGRTELYR